MRSLAGEAPRPAQADQHIGNHVPSPLRAAPSPDGHQLNRPQVQLAIDVNGAVLPVDGGYLAQ